MIIPDYTGRENEDNGLYYYRARWGGGSRGCPILAGFARVGLSFSYYFLVLVHSTTRAAELGDPLPSFHSLLTAHWHFRLLVGFPNFQFRISNFAFLISALCFAHPHSIIEPINHR